jgi:hypothetical protein
MKKLHILLALLALVFLPAMEAQTITSSTVPTPTITVTAITTPAGVTTTRTTYAFAGVTSVNLAAVRTAALGETPTAGGTCMSYRGYLPPSGVGTVYATYQ